MIASQALSTTKLASFELMDISQ